MKDYVIRYRPQLYEGNNEMNALYKAQQDLYVEADTDKRTLRSNMFVNSADLDAIKKYERTYELKEDSDLTLEQRRANVINKIIFRPPFTRQRFNEILSSYYDEGHYVYDIYPNIFTVVIDIDVDDPEVYMAFNDMVRRLIPSNMTLILAIQYTYLYLRRNYTYESLAQHTYVELSQYSTMNNNISVI